jgi:hypothetical protein
METLVGTFPKGASFLIELPFTSPPQPSVLYVPRSGPGGFYTQTGGVILPQPVANLQWDGDSFRFNTLLRVFGPGGGYYTVTGAIDTDGSVHGTLQHLGAGAQPSYDYVGRHAR